MTNGVGALVLAAGRGTRVGGPKALLMVQGVPLASAHVTARLRDCERVIVVTRREIARELPVEDGGRVQVVISEEPDEHGPAGSIRAAVKSGAIASLGKLIVTPVDVLPALSRSIHRLLLPLDAGFLAVRFAHGHPIACAAAVLVERYRGDREGAPPPLREVLEALGESLCRLQKVDDDPNVTEELDEIADVARVTGAQPKFWRPA